MSTHFWWVFIYLFIYLFFSFTSELILSVTTTSIYLFNSWELPSNSGHLCLTTELLFQNRWTALLKGTLTIKTGEKITYSLSPASWVVIACSKTKVHSITRADNITFNILCQAALAVCVVCKVCNRLFPDSHSFVPSTCHWAASHSDESPKQITPQREASTSQPVWP